ncbi:MAG: polysaccharide biosynthesis tyrosine autokinase [Roseivirga sp.]|nr:polysaccharide biosynthesis tyrosine autokinase [Roseivirga sp.]
MNSKVSDKVRATNKSVELSGVIARGLKKWYWFVLGGICAILGAMAYIKYTEPIYEITGKVIIEEERERESLGPSAFGLNPSFLSDGISLNNEIELLESRGLMADAVRKLRLNVEYLKKLNLIDEELYSASPVKLTMIDSLERYDLVVELTPTDQNGYRAEVSLPVNGIEMLGSVEGEFGKTVSFQNKRFIIEKIEDFDFDLTISVKNPRAIASRYIRRMNIAPVLQSEVLDISLKVSDPEKAILLMHELIDSYNKQVIENKSKSTIKTLDFIDGRLKIIEEELFEIEYQLAEFKRENNLILDLGKSAQDYLSKLDISNTQIAEVDLQLKVLSAIKQEMQALDNDKLILVNPNIGKAPPAIVVEYNNLVLKRKELLVSATPENPAVKLLDQQLALARKNIIDWMNFKTEEVEDQKAYLVEESKPVTELAEKLPENERELLQIMRQQVIKETLYNFLLQRREETAMSIASEVSNARFVNVPSFKAQLSPNVLRVYLVFIFLFCGAPIVILYLQELFDNYIYDKEDIRAATEAPYIGELPTDESTSNFRLRKDSKTVMAEMFRLLRTNLNYLTGTKEKGVFLITSSISGEGKTFVSMNIAASFALSGKKVCVIGFDLRKPKLSRYIIGDNNLRGVSDYLVEQVDDIDSLVNPVQDHENLFFISSGPIPPNPNELILKDRTGELINYLRDKFDVLVIDSSPVGLVADSFGLKEHVDHTLYVTKYEYTEKEHLNLIDDIYVNQKLPNVAIILNGVKKRLGRYGKTSGYAYSYGYGYGENEHTTSGKIRKKFRKS